MTINILGMPMITVAGKTTSAKDFKAPVSWKAIAYLALDNAPITAAALASKIGCAENTDSASGNMRANIHRIRGRSSRKAPADVIISNGHGYILNPYYTICTDAKEMERLWNKAQASNDRNEEIHLLTMAFKLYRGDLCEGIDSTSDCHGSGFDWLQGEREYYRQLYNKTANTLMELLAEERDYSSIWNCVNEAKSAIKTGTADWYCWRIFSQMKLSGKISAQEGYAEAHRYLLAAERESLDKHLKEVLSRFG